METISEQLRRELPGLRGFSVRNLKNMRTFYEEWRFLEANSAVGTAEIATSDNSAVGTAELKNIDNQISVVSRLPFIPTTDFPIAAFFSIGFTHHTAILTKTKDLEERLFYIQLCYDRKLKVEEIETLMNEDYFHHQGKLPNNFLQTIPNRQTALRSIELFKDEYLLDFINVEQLGERDLQDVDENVVEQEIVQNVKNFIMVFGKSFSFIGNQVHYDKLGHDHWVDLLFFNRELRALVVVELKKGTFKPAYLGQLAAYLRILDDDERLAGENPSVGIILCKDADRAYVEYVLQDYNKPMGVATYKATQQKLSELLPDEEELKKLL